MSIPETTSAEAFERYVGGRCLAVGHGEAWRLLRETKMSVVDVALEVGYANPGHFSQLFRRETGLSPSVYRRQR